VFVDVHNKVRAFKDRLREVNKGNADLREDRLLRETKELNETERIAPRLTSPASDSTKPQEISTSMDLDPPAGELLS